MDIDIQEMTGEALAMDVQAFKAEIVAEVVARIAQEKRLDTRLSQAREMRTTAMNRPQDLV